MRPPTYITPDGREVHLELRPQKNGANQFACLIDGEEQVTGDWLECLRFGGGRDWKHVATQTAQKRIAASTDRKSRGLMLACASTNSENSFGL